MDKLELLVGADPSIVWAYIIVEGVLPCLIIGGFFAAAYFTIKRITDDLK